MVGRNIKKLTLPTAVMGKVWKILWKKIHDRSVRLKKLVDWAYNFKKNGLKRRYFSEKVFLFENFLFFGKSKLRKKT